MFTQAVGLGFSRGPVGAATTRRGAAMADIFCNGCGLVYDSHVYPCPRCQRCARCGTYCKAGENQCSLCEYPSDAQKVAEEEKKLDPLLPANAKAIRSLAIVWENGVLMGRLNLRGKLFVALFCGVYFGVVLGETADVEGFWLRASIQGVCGLVLYVLFLGFLRLLRHGWFRWLLRDKP